MIAYFYVTAAWDIGWNYPKQMILKQFWSYQAIEQLHNFLVAES